MRSAEEHRKLADALEQSDACRCTSSGINAAEALREIAAETATAGLRDEAARLYDVAHLIDAAKDAILSLVAPHVATGAEERAAGIALAAEALAETLYNHDISGPEIDVGVRWGEAPEAHRSAYRQVASRMVAYPKLSPFLRTTPTRFYTEAEMREAVERTQALWDERRQILEDAGADEFDLIRDRDAWKRKAEAAIEALRPFAAWHSANVADWDLFEGHEPLEGGAASSAKVSDLRRAASLVSDHDRAKEASDAG